MKILPNDFIRARYNTRDSFHIMQNEITFEQKRSVMLTNISNAKDIRRWQKEGFPLSRCQNRRGVYYDIKTDINRKIDSFYFLLVPCYEKTDTS